MEDVVRVTYVLPQASEGGSMAAQKAPGINRST
jgi:hypothetical protein